MLVVGTPGFQDGVQIPAVSLLDFRILPFPGRKVLLRAGSVYGVMYALLNYTVLQLFQV